MTLGYQAATEVADQLGLTVDEPVLIQETNNTVVWLRPHPVIAKVGSHADGADRLIREHQIASELTTLGAPVAPPLPEASPIRHETTGYVVTLWCRLEHDADAQTPASAVARSLGQLHQALADCDVVLPDFRVDIERARAALFNDRAMAALASDDRNFLRAAFSDLVAELDSLKFTAQALHGEPHNGNVLHTPSRLRWIDFENSCHGPLELDLTFVPDGARVMFTDIDTTLFELLKTLNSSCVATWCWVQARFPEMQRHGEHHLALVRRRWPMGS